MQPVVCSLQLAKVNSAY